MRLPDTPITSLPDNFKVGGSLILSNTKITSLPDNLKVGRLLDLSDTPITSLPDNIKIGGSIDLSNTKITSLPDNFKIGGFQIGDSISIQNFENIESYKTYENTNLLVGNPKGNENIEVEIIDKKYIYKITQKNIVRNEIENIIKVINDKIKIEPDTIKKSKPRYREGFRWESNGIIIRLLKRDMYQYYTDRAEKITKSDFRSQILKSTMFNLATKQLGNDKYYELEYENELLETILKNTGNKTIQSSIIE